MDTIEHFAGLCAVLSREAFLSRMPGPGVLIRLDDRGGKDEPTPWAFQNITNTIARPFEAADELNAEQMRNVLAEVTEVSPKNRDSDVFTNAPADEVTNTMARPVQGLPLPSARGAASVYPINGENKQALLGRADTANIVIEEMSISKHHARFSWASGGKIQITDVGSANGTRVNQHVLQENQPKELSCGDQIFLGDIHFLYLDRDSFFTHLPQFMD